MNFLEQLAAEWYRYQGYFVRTNVRTDKLSHGGYAGEMDVLAYEPNKGEFVHIETSTDALRVLDREKRMRRKFNLSHEAYERAFNVKVRQVRKIAVCSSKTKSDGLRWGDIEMKTIKEFLNEIWDTIADTDFIHAAVPETFPLLRMMQMTAWAVKPPQRTK
jgi:hypothetical protein